MAQTRMTPKRRAEAVNDRLRERYPDAPCALEAEGDAWKLLVMARLSAQCTDERVNLISEELFRVFPTAEAMAAGELSEIESLIRSCGLFRGKAKNIKDASAIIHEKYGGRVPDTMDELLALPGVGRKIANLILGDVYGCGGIVADTHCIRICGRLGFYPEGEKNPLKCERAMEKLIERSEQSDFCHRIVMFGREICDARAPRCGECPLADVCKYNLTKKKG